jgi:ABC-type transporter Mla subunit MlaD
MLSKLRLVAEIVFFLAVTLLVVEGIATLRQVRSQLNDTVTKLNNTLSLTNSAIGVFHDAEQKQAEFYDPAKPGGFSQQGQRILTSIKGLMVRTDLNLNGRDGNGGVLPQLSAALGNTNQLAQHITAGFDADNARLEPILADLGTGASAFARQTPHILTHIDNSVGQIDLASVHYEKVSENFDGMTTDGRAFVHRELAPVTGTWNALKGFLREFAGPAAEVATAIK